MNKWYKAGYIGSDFPGLNIQQQQALFDSGSQGLIIDACVVTYNRARMLGFEADSAPYPRLEANQRLHWNYSDAFPQGGELTLVTAASKHIPEACRWLNYGLEGKTWTYVNGVPTFTDYALNHEYQGGDPNVLLKVTFTAKLTYPDVACSINLALTPQSRAMRMKYMDDPLLDKALILPPFKMTPDESTEVSRIMGDIRTYCDEMTLKFITGEVPLDQWANFVRQVKALGIDRAVEIYQAAYRRYMS
jgi:putative aldouronate transport system substrate-binding protein